MGAPCYLGAPNATSDLPLIFKAGKQFLNDAAFPGITFQQPEMKECLPRAAQTFGPLHHPHQRLLQKKSFFFFIVPPHLPTPACQMHGNANNFPLFVVGVYAEA